MKLFQVDAFTQEVFKGNPAGVCLLEKPAAESWMQDLAREMNVSETAFVHPEGAGYRLRWFTPTMEVDLCGHATLSTAHILWELGLAPAEATLSFHTLSGVLKAARGDDLIELDFPTSEVKAAPIPEGLLAALTIRETPRFFGMRSNGVGLIEVSDEAIVRGLTPNFGALKAVDLFDAVVTARARAGSDYDFVSRVFVPRHGIDEDPVTGSAHCALGPYWRERLKKDMLEARQVSARGGRVRVRFAGDRVLLGGNAVTVFEIRMR